MPYGVAKCSICSTRVGGKLATLYWAWFTLEGERIAWKQKLCSGCAHDFLGQLLQAAAEETGELVKCPGCGQDSSQNLEGMYLSLFLPKQEMTAWSLLTCAGCAYPLRAQITETAERLPDRNGSAVKAEPGAGWEALGVKPRT